MDPLDYNFIKHEVLALTGIDLNFYKDTQMHRRLNFYLMRSGHPTWRSFFELARADAGTLDKFKDYLTINVSSFFRDADKYHHLQQTILPQLLNEKANLRVWSAGCSKGQEPYSLAMLLSELTGPHQKHFILGSDLDRAVLETARAGGPYVNDDVINVPPLLLKRYFETRDNRYWVNEKLRGQVTFYQQNLLADRFEGNFDLIICRNVVIYFTAEIKDVLYQRFYEALRPGGILFVGGTEIVPKSHAIGFESAGISFYRRNGHK